MPKTVKFAIYVQAMTSLLLQCKIVPYSVMVGVLGCLALIFIRYVIKLKNIKSSFGWLLPFYIYAISSAIWTINSFYAFMLTMITTAAVLGLVIAFYYKEYGDKTCLVYFKGLVHGGIILCFAVLFLEHENLGTARIGTELFGSFMGLSLRLVCVSIVSFAMLKLTRKKRYLLYLLLFLIVGVFSGSRSAIGYPILFFLVLYCWTAKNIQKVLACLIIFLFIAALSWKACMTFAPLYNVVGYRLETILVDRDGDKSYMERKNRKEVALAAWNEAPITGWGIAAFGCMWDSLPITHSHCGYTEILVSYGLIGFLLFYSNYIFILYNIKKHKPSMMQKSLFSMAFVFFLMENSTELFSSIYEMPLFVLAISISRRKNCDMDEIIYSKSENVELGYIRKKYLKASS